MDDDRLPVVLTRWAHIETWKKNRVLSSIASLLLCPVGSDDSRAALIFKHERLWRSDDGWAQMATACTEPSYPVTGMTTKLPEGEGFKHDMHT